MAENNTNTNWEEFDLPKKENEKKKFDILGVLKKLFSPKWRIWTIVICSSILLIAGAIFVLVFNSPANVAERYMKAVCSSDLRTRYALAAYDAQQYAMGDQSEEEYFELMSNRFEEDIDSWSDFYKVYKRDGDDSLYDTYGDYKFSVEATRTKHISSKKLEEECANRLKNLEEKGLFDRDSISEAKEVTVKVKLAGEDETERWTATVYVVKIGRAWKVLDYNKK